MLSFNFVDIYYRIGVYKSEKPEILGREGAGVVVALVPRLSSMTSHWVIGCFGLGRQAMNS